jgi:hypothetical protein
LGQAKASFSGLKFGAKTGATWSVVLPASYASKMKTIKTKQLTEGEPAWRRCCRLSFRDGGVPVWSKNSNRLKRRDFQCEIAERT